MCGFMCGFLGLYHSPLVEVDKVQTAKEGRKEG